MKRLVMAAALGAQACAPAAPVATPAPPKVPHKVAGPARGQLPPALWQPAPDRGRAVVMPHVKLPEKVRVATTVRAPKTTPTTLKVRARQPNNVGASAGVNLEAVAQCESGGRPNAVSPDGKYRGLLQFDQQTWESVGGTGDPAAASADEQMRRGQMLYAQRGAAPWPTCGKRAG